MRLLDLHGAPHASYTGYMTKLLLVIGHAKRDSLTHALADAYQAGAESQGVGSSRLELASLSFDLVLRSGHRGEQPLEPDLARAQQALRDAKHVAWFFPTWWAAPPALVKGFIDRVLLPGFGYRYEPGRAPHRKLLGGRSARLVTTMDAPWWWYALFYRSALHASFIKATLRFVGFGPVKTLTGYGLRGASRRRVAQRVARLLERSRHAGAKDARALDRAAARERFQAAAPTSRKP